MALIIGLLGQIASGKSYIGRFLEMHGFYYINSDYLGHKALDESHNELRVIFGDSCIGIDQKVDRSYLSSIVFNDMEKLKSLESVVHPKIQKLLEEELLNKEKVVLESVLLFKMQWDSYCKYIFYIEAPLSLRFIRFILRDGFFKKSFYNINKIQTKFKSECFTKRPDTIIINNGYMRKDINKILYYIQRG